MPMELVCGHCEGHLQADEPGSVVACPHCGTHLHVPLDGSPDESTPESPAPDVAPTMLPEIESTSLMGMVTSELEPVPDVPAAAPDSLETTLTVDPALAIEEPPPAAGETPMSELVSHSMPNLVPIPAAASPGTAEAPPPPPATPSPPPMAASPQPSSLADINYQPPPPAMVPRSWFLFMLSYSSAVTIAFVFTLISLARVKSHPLESLPDVVPKIQNGEVAMQVAPVGAKLAPGHELALGQTRRFGSLKVTPLRVTQGRLQFEHHLKDPARQRPPSEPVLKLWLRFENVSRNQKFMPLDPLLLYKRHYQDFGNTVLTNQFLCRTDERKKGGDLRNLYELSATSEFIIAGQNLETVLGPGESLETFIPSEENLERLGGDLVWRVQFRKGYHPRTRHGVTTLIEVPFNRTDVKKES